MCGKWTLGPSQLWPQQSLRESQAASDQFFGKLFSQGGTWVLRPPDMPLNKFPLSGETSAAVEAPVCLADLHDSVKRRLQPALCSGVEASRLEPLWESGGDPARERARESLPDAPDALCITAEGRRLRDAL